jgi:hypothetical protein
VRPPEVEIHQVARAATAGTKYFKPQKLEVRQDVMLFEDGGLRLPKVKISKYHVLLSELANIAIVSSIPSGGHEAISGNRVSFRA